MIPPDVDMAAQRPTTEFYAGGYGSVRVTDPAFFVRLLDRLPLEVRNLNQGSEGRLLDRVDDFIAPRKVQDRFDHKKWNDVPGEWAVSLQFYHTSASGTCFITDPAELKVWRDLVSANLGSKITQAALAAEAIRQRGAAEHKDAMGAYIKAFQKTSRTPEEEALLGEADRFRWNRTMGAAEWEAAPLQEEALAWLNQGLAEKGFEDTFAELLDVDPRAAFRVDVGALHTPGPWQVKEQGEANQYCLLGPDDQWALGLIHSGAASLACQQEANLQLAAETPVLFDLARRLEGASDGDLPRLVADARVVTGRVRNVAHSPGPWNVGGRNAHVHPLVCDGRGDWLLGPRDNREPLEAAQVANIHLVAAGPDLLVLAKRLAVALPGELPRLSAEARVVMAKLQG